MLDGEGEDEAAEDEGDDVVHEGMCHVISGGDSEERKEKERSHGGDGHGDRLSHPPLEDPRHHAQHVPGAIWTVHLHARAYHRAHQRSQKYEERLRRHHERFEALPAALLLRR